MREASFIEQNKQKWVSIEINLGNKSQIDPDILASNYIELTNHLAYAQTFYPRSKTKEYLNELSIRAHQLIYKDQKPSNNKLASFFQYEIFHSIYTIRKPLFYSLLIFLLANAIGFISAHYENSFLELILDKRYVDMTAEILKMETQPASINLAVTGEVLLPSPSTMPGCVSSFYRWHIRQSRHRLYIIQQRYHGRLKIYSC